MGLRGQALDNQQEAEARELVLAAEKGVADDPGLGLLLGLEAVAAFDDATGVVPTPALQVLRSGIREQHVRARFRGGGWATTIAERGAIATAGDDADDDGVADGIAIFDVESSEPIASIVIEGWMVRLRRTVGRRASDRRRAPMVDRCR